MLNRRRFLGTLVGAGAIAGGARGRVGEPDGFYVPAEDVPHELTLMQWPVSREVYPDVAFLGMIQRSISRIANAISDFEPVVMLADRHHHASARRLLSERVELWDIPTEDLWARDSGPIVAIDRRGHRAVRHIRFNGWGGKQVHRHDGRIADRVADALGLPLIATPLQGEAGGVDQDGHGLLMAHESSWVIGNRNPGLSRAEVATALLDAYGASQIIWAPGVQGADITDYHIDSLARFTGPGRVLMTLPDAPSRRDPFHQAALVTHDILDAAGLEIEVIPEPEYRRVQAPDFVASYANYYVCNGAVIAPQFGDQTTDVIAADAIGRHHPGREVITLNVDPIGEVGGGIHCATHELPAAGASTQ